MAQKNLFNSVRLMKPKMNVFDLTHDVKLTTQMGVLTPVMCTECIPGDKFMIGSESLIRFSPLVSPAMHRFDVYIHYFFVPNRILWENWEDYITNTPQGSSLPAFPTVTINEAVYQEGSLADYLGIPAPVAEGTSEIVSALPFAAYQAIWNEYYRDQNLQEEVDYTVFDGDNLLTPVLGTIRRRCWEHDYLTAALPFAQKGQAVNVPGLFEDVPVAMGGVAGGGFLGVQSSFGPGATPMSVVSEDSTNPDIADNLFYAQTSELGNATINDLRRAFRLQEWLERSALGGSRYAENIRAFFGVQPQDSRLQRPEYITGSKSPVIISEVLNTAGGDLPQGNMAGHGVSVNAGKFGTYNVYEHGYIMGIMSIMPKTAYQQGIPKHFLKINDPFEFFWPQFANIGEQPVLGREVFAYEAVYGDQTFGYVPRYAEYKFENNRVAGQFRTSLNFWHEGRIFAFPPNLNSEFVECNPSNRIFAVTSPSVDKMICHVLNRVRAVRGMPVYGTPSF